MQREYDINVSVFATKYYRIRIRNRKRDNFRTFAKKIKIDWSTRVLSSVLSFLDGCMVIISNIIPLAVGH